LVGGAYGSLKYVAVALVRLALRRHNTKKKNTNNKNNNKNACPLPSQVFSVTIETNTNTFKNKNKNKNKKNTSKNNIENNIRNYLNTSTTPTLFIVTQPSPEHVMTRQQQALVDNLMEKTLRPERRGVSVFETTENELLKSKLHVPSFQTPYAILYTPRGNVLHVSQNPTNVRNFLKKNAANFGITVNKLQGIQKRKYPTKSLQNVLDIRYAALQRTVKPTNAGNLKRAYKRVSSQTSQTQSNITSRI
jgi:hypothetical protein